MIKERNILLEKREKALQNLRERRKEDRKYTSDRSSSESNSSSFPLEHFVQLDTELEAEIYDSEQLLTESEPDQEIAEIRQRLRQVKSLRRERKYQVELEPQTDYPALSGSQEKHQELMAEVLSAHFQDNIKLWVSSVDSKLELSSTSLAEIEQYQQEVQYRHKLLKVMLDTTQKELNELEIHIRALKTLN
jgi:hypothetical protein